MNIMTLESCPLCYFRRSCHRKYKHGRSAKFSEGSNTSDINVRSSNFVLW